MLTKNSLKSLRSSIQFKKFKLKKFVVLLTSCLAVSTAFANPQGGAVVAGSASISSAGNTTTIQQSSQQAIIQWNSFNISKGQTTQFVQPSSSSVALNRINPAQGASQIFGTLTANGQLILVNAAGINFSSGATVNVAGLIASTSDISNSNFLAGNYVFNVPSTYANATISNAGKIIAANNGLVALVGNKVSNTGMIQAHMGTVILAAGGMFTVDFNGDGLINFSVDSPAPNAKVSNTGSIMADGGQILVSAQTASSVLDNVIDMEGTAEANSVSQQNGEIILAANGGVTVGGNLSAQGTAAGTSGGTVQITSDAINVASGAQINVSGNYDGGTVSFNPADSSTSSYTQLGWGSSVIANAATGIAGGVIFNSAFTGLSGSLVSVTGTGTGSFGGSITVNSNTINVLYGSLLTANGDELGGDISLSGTSVNGEMANAATINLDIFSQISANSTGSDAIVGGFINLYANTENLAGGITATGGSGVGGGVNVYGQNINVLPGAFISASAQQFAGDVNIGGNPLSATSDTNSANVLIAPFSYVGAAATGVNGFGGDVNVSADNVVIGGELDVSGNPFPYLTYSYSGSNAWGFPTFTATLNNSGSSAGFISVTGTNINLLPGAYLNAAGNLFGGQIMIGSSPGSAPTTNNIIVNSGSLLDVGAYGTTNDPIAGIIQLYANNTTVNGTLNASGVANSGSMAGEIKILAQNTVTVGPFATLLANADTDGGEILIGGDLNGTGSDPNALYTNVGPFATISASAFTNGTGGEVVVWSQDATDFSGTISARGGALSGNGGEVEVSGAGTVNFNGYVDVSAPNGSPGTVTIGANTTTGNYGNLSNLSLYDLLGNLLQKF